MKFTSFVVLSILTSIIVFSAIIVYAIYRVQYGLLALIAIISTILLVAGGGSCKVRRTYIKGRNNKIIIESTISHSLVKEIDLIE
jgi:hypothetical protein